MGCCYSRAVKEDQSPPPKSYSTHTSGIGVEDSTNSNDAEVPLSDLELDVRKEGDDSIISNRKVVLSDIEAEYPAEQSSDLEGVIMAILGSENEEPVAFEKSSETTSSWPGVLTLSPRMDSLNFIARLKGGEELGNVLISRDEVHGFLTLHDDIEVEKSFTMTKTAMSLKLYFTINVFEVSDETPAFDTEEIEQMMKNASKDPSSFPNTLRQLSNAGPDYVHLFGFYFSHRFEETGKVDDINHAIEALELAMKHTTPSDPAHATYAHAAGAGYLSRFRVSGSAPDMEEALTLLELSALRTREGDVALPERLSRLGIAYRVRFKATGEVDDLEKALLHQQRAVHLTQANHPDFSARLNALGNSFNARFGRKSELGDINRAISYTERALEMATDRHDDMPLFLSNLGSFYQTRFRTTGVIEDSENGIKYQQRAIDIARKKNPRMAELLNNLGVSYRVRFSATGVLADIDMSIQFLKQAVESTGDGHTLLPMHLRNLGNSYHTRFRQTGNSVDVNLAIEIHEQAVKLTLEGHADLPARLGSLGTCLHSRFKHLKNEIDVLDALTSFQKAATYHTGRPSIRLSAARSWGLLCRTHLPSQSLEAFKVVIELLSQIAGLDLTIQKRHRDLLDISYLTSLAASVAMTQGEISTAVEWLEQGRCLVWNQINQLRTPVDRLHEHDAELAQRFRRVARMLEDLGAREDVDVKTADHAELKGPTGELANLINAQDEIHKHVQLAKEYSTLLARIRLISGFESFLLPPKISDILSKLPKDGAVVTFILHQDQDRCDALILKRGLPSPIHLPLASMSPKKATDLAIALQSILKDRGLRMREVDFAIKDDLTRGLVRMPKKVDRVTLSGILETLWVSVVEGVVRRICGKVPLERKERPRIWWCPTGPLAFLPLHAAGIYNKKGSSPGLTASDFAVSSYTPTISALLNSLDQQPQVSDSSNLHRADLTTTATVPSTNFLLISQPHTPGLSPIPGTSAESREIQKLFSGYTTEDSASDLKLRRTTNTLLLEGAEATVARVRDELRSHAWVHFACHAAQDKESSVKSGLHLHDGRLDLLEMMKQHQYALHAPTGPSIGERTDSSPGLKPAFAFLSACQTGTGDEKLPDEVVHIAAGMLAVGYTSVVATMWSIKDAYGKDVAVSFYRHLLDSSRKLRLSIDPDGSRPDLKDDLVGRTAWALDCAVRDLRVSLKDEDDEVALLTWVPYVHYGA